MHYIGYPVELGGLTAQPELINAYAFPIQFHGHNSVAAAGAGKARGFGKGAYLYGACARALYFIDGAGQVALYKGLIGGVKEDYGVSGVGIVYPGFKLLTVVYCAGGIIGRADIYYVRLYVFIRKGKEAVFAVGVYVIYRSAVHYVDVYICRIYRVGDKGGVGTVE